MNTHKVRLNVESDEEVEEEEEGEQEEMQGAFIIWIFLRLFQELIIKYDKIFFAINVMILKYKCF